MAPRQQIQIRTADGEQTLDADRVLIIDGEYVILNGDEEIRRIPCAEIVQEGESSGIETVFSRS